MGDPDVAVLRQKIHGMTATDYAEALKPRLPDKEIVVARTPTEELDLLQRVPVATGFSVDAETVRSAANLDLFACAFAGTDHLPIAAFEDAGVAVTNASGVHGPNVSEYVLGAILSFVRGFPRAWRQGERREWRSYPAHELQGSTVTVVGMGAIGEGIVDRLAPFGVETLGVRYSPEKGAPDGVSEVFGFDEVHEPLSRTDYLALACPLTDATAELIDTEAFLTLPSEAVLVNVARGGVVDTDDLVGALRSNEIRGAALDVTDPEPLPENHPLWGFDNVQITPHNAGHTPNYYERLSEILADNVERLAAGDDLRNRVA